MKVRAVAVVAGVGGTLICSGRLDGGFVGLHAVERPNPQDLWVVSVYADFDNPGNDLLYGVGGTPTVPLNLVVEDGLFWDHPEGGNTAPTTEAIASLPSLAFDSFFTIGVQAVGPPPLGQPADSTVVVSMPPFLGWMIQTNQGYWAALPGSPQIDPFDPAHSYRGNGRILIGQFATTAAASRMTGTVVVSCLSDGEQDLFLGTFDLRETTCPGECYMHGEVDVQDFLALLAQWGQVGAPCDLDGGGVGVTDFLTMLAHWGPCPP